MDNCIRALLDETLQALKTFVEPLSRTENQIIDRLSSLLIGITDSITPRKLSRFIKPKRNDESRTLSQLFLQKNLVLDELKHEMQTLFTDIENIKTAITENEKMMSNELLNAIEKCESEQRFMEKLLDVTLAQRIMANDEIIADLVDEYERQQIAFNEEALCNERTCTFFEQKDEKLTNLIREWTLRYDRDRYSLSVNEEAYQENYDDFLKKIDDTKIEFVRRKGFIEKFNEDKRLDGFLNNFVTDTNNS